MNLIGQTVKHGVFGKGTVTGRDQQVLTVHFPAGNHSFLYPEAFSKYLVAQNPELQRQILARIESEKNARQAEEHREMERWEKEIALRSRKIPTRSQGAFDLTPGETERVFTDWIVSTGTYLSGFSRGEPRIPDRMGPNSLCLLTLRQPGQPETDRKIVGLFMPIEDFEGKDCTDGIIRAHPDYRIRLSKNEQLPFWPFITDAKEKMKWGSTAFKYLPNETAAQLVKKLCSSSDKASRKAFYRYFCELNHLETDE